MAKMYRSQWGYGQDEMHENCLYETEDIDEWLELSHNHEGKLLSPGGVASAVGVQRWIVNNWIFRDLKVTAYVCRPNVNTTYTLVDLESAKTAAKYVRKSPKRIIEDDNKS